MDVADRHGGDAGPPVNIAFTRSTVTGRDHGSVLPDGDAMAPPGGQHFCGSSQLRV
jgi:hypothetical protein